MADTLHLITGKSKMGPIVTGWRYRQEHEQKK